MNQKDALMLQITLFEIKKATKWFRNFQNERDNSTAN